MVAYYIYFQLPHSLPRAAVKIYYYDEPPSARPASSGPVGLPSLLLCSSSTSLINYTVRFRAALSIAPLPGRYLRVCSDLASSRKSSRFYFQEWVARARVRPRGASWSCQRGALAVTDGDPALARPCCQPQFDRSNQSGVRPMEGWLEGCWIQG